MISLVAYGGGRDSTAALIEMIRRGEPAPRAILTADTGDRKKGKFGEKPETYAYVDMFSEWLQNHNYPPVTWVRKGGNDETLEESCLRLGVLPAIAYGHKTCSQRFKIEPQDKWANNDPVCQGEWASGRKITKIIGYNWDEVHRAHFYEDEKYERRYPLIDWRIGRERCAEIILSAGLPLPPKSACFYCPHMKPHEVRALAKQHPNLLSRALRLEANAKDLQTVKGLGRNFRWADVIAQGEMFPEIYDKQPDEMPCGCYDGAA